MLCIGTAGLAVLKTKADPNLGAAKVWAGEMAFIVLLFAVSVSGLALYWLGDSDLIDILLPLHLAVVFTLFLMMPYSKMVHGFYRLAALTRDAADVRLKSVK
jgi:citrate/tricarballylate utilization protein